MHLTIATAGHIDHGKSTLVEALTGIHPDRLKEERVRGISIELGFAHTRLGDEVLSFVDVPGHERFVRTMLAGVGGIDAVLLVVAADESVMPQTREHLDICTLLDVPRGVIALTRCDLADDTMQAIAEDETRALVAGTPLADAPLVRVSARTGEGLDELRAALRTCVPPQGSRQTSGPIRLPVDRAFSVKGFGTVVTGTLWSGTLLVETPMTLVSADGRETAVRARGLQVHGEPASQAVAGQRVAVNLAGVPLEAVARGDLLVGDGAVLVSRSVAVRVRVLPGAPAQRHGTRVHVHLGTTAAVGRLLVPEGESIAGRRVIPPGGTSPARLRLETPLPVRRGDRLVLRAYSPMATVAGAVVDDPRPPPRAGGRPAALTPEAPLDWLALRIEEAAGAGVPVAEVAPRCGVSPSTADDLVARLVTAGRIVRAGDHWVSASQIEALTSDLLARVDAAQGANRWDGGIPRAELRQALGRRARPALVDLVLEGLGARGLIAGDARVTRALATATSTAEDQVAGDVLDAIRSASLQGQTAADLERAFAGRVDRKALAAILARHAKTGQLDRVGDFYVARLPLEELVKDLRHEAEQGHVPPRIDVGWFKERYRLSRKAAIPLLEWLDRTRVTRRDGDARVLLAGK